MWDYDTERQEFSGFVPRLLTLLQNELGNKLVLTPLPLPADDMSEIFTLLPVVAGEVDLSLVAASEAIFSAFNASEVVFTTSFKESKYTGLLRRSVSSPNTFRLLEPLTEELWLAIGISIVVCAVCMVLIDNLRPAAADEKLAARRKLAIRSGMTGFVRASYHAMAAVLGGEDSEWLTMPARLLRLSLLFLVMIFAATCASTHAHAQPHLRLSALTYHLSPITLTYHLSPSHPLTYHLSPITYHLSPITPHLSPITPHPLAHHLSPITAVTRSPSTPPQTRPTSPHSSTSRATQSSARQISHSSATLGHVPSLTQPRPPSASSSTTSPCRQ